MHNLLEKLEKIDEEILLVLAESDVDESLLARQIEKREVLLSQIFLQFPTGFSTISSDWQQIILRSNYILERMQTITDRLACDLRNHRRGKELIKRYKQI